MKLTNKSNGTLVSIFGLCALGTLALVTLVPEGAEAQTPVRTQPSIKLDASVMKKGHAAKKIGSVEVMERVAIPPDDFRKMTSQLPRPTRALAPATPLTNLQKLDAARAVVPELSPSAKVEQPFSIGIDGVSKGLLTVSTNNRSPKEHVIALAHTGHITMPGSAKGAMDSFVELQFPTSDGYVYTVECGVARAGGVGGYKIDDYKNATKLMGNGGVDKLVFVHVGGGGAHYTIYYTGEQMWTFKGCTVTPISG